MKRSEAIQMLIRSALACVCLAVFMGLTVWTSFFFRPMVSAPRALLDLQGTWETCGLDAVGGDVSLCHWNATHIPGPIPDVTKQSVKHEVVLRKTFSLPDACRTQACVLLVGQVSDVASFTLNEFDLGASGMFPPALSPKRLHPMAVQIPSDAVIGEPVVLQARFWSHYPRRLGLERSPVMITTVQDAEIFMRGQTFSLIFLPLACALGLILVAAMVSAFIGSKQRLDPLLAVFVVFCVSGVAYLASFADVHYALHDMRSAVLVRFISKRIYDCAFFAFFLFALSWTGWAHRVFSSLFWLTCAVCAGGCGVAIYTTFTAPKTYDAVATISLVVYYIWRTKLAAGFAGCIASILMFKKPGWLMRLCGFAFATAILYYDSLVFLEIPVGEYGSKFHYLAFAGFFAGMIVRRDAQEQARTMMRKESDAAVGRMAKQVAHDIRSPIAALNAQIKSIVSLPEEPRQIIRSAVGRINDIANILLLRHETSPTKERRAVCLANVLDSLATEARLRHRSRLDVVIEFEVSETNCNLFSCLNATELRRAVANLLNNAVEAIEGTGVVVVELMARDQWVQIAIRDSGRGIPPEVVQRLGTMGFTQGKPHGSGLGFYQAQKFACEHGGNLQVASEVGKGTTITLVVRQHDAPAWFAQKIELFAQSSVAIVDDDASIHQIWSQRFANMGLNIHHYSSPADYLNHPPEESALHLVDYEFIGHSGTGLDLLPVVSGRGPCILVTSHAEEPSVYEGAASAGVSVLPKNFAAWVPIVMKQEIFDAVLLDDDPLVHLSWQMAARRAGRRLRTFQSSAQLFAALPTLSLEIPIYVDFNLLDATGDDTTKRLSHAGFQTLYMVTGENAEDLPKMPWLKAIMSKDPPKHWA